MNLKLVRVEYRADGIFSDLFDEQGERIAVVLEHAYPTPSGEYIPKLPPGEYTCRLGMHILEHMKEPFATYEIADVPGHSNILFHTGNFNNQSSGCCVVGTSKTILNGVQMLTGSRIAFRRLMSLQNEVPEFSLKVV